MTVLVVVVVGLVVALFFATRDADGVGAMTPVNKNPAVVQPLPDQ